MWRGWFRFQTPTTKTCKTITKKGFQHKILNNTNLFAVILKNLYKPFHPNVITGKVTKTIHYHVKKFTQYRTYNNAKIHNKWNTKTVKIAIQKSMGFDSYQ